MDRQDEYVLFVDESGTASPKDVFSRYYILAGCVVLDGERDRLKNWANHIKYKYWGNTDVVFHSKEITRKEGDFQIFKDKSIFDSFIQDFEKCLLGHNIHCFFVIVDKKDPAAKRWNNIKIYKETSDSVIKTFLTFLMIQKAKGKVVIESATTQKDFYFHLSLSNYLSNGVSIPKITHEQVKETLTSISFVTKKNFDIEEQIADMLAYAAKCEYMKRKNIKFRRDIYEDMLLNVLNKKIVTKSKIPKILRPKYTKKIKNFVILP